jgi:hypothetical protein
MACLRRLVVLAVAIEVVVGCAAPNSSTEQHLQQLDATEMNEANEFYKARPQKPRLVTETAVVVLVAEPSADARTWRNVAYPVHFKRQDNFEERTSRGANGADGNCDEIIPWTDTTAALVLRLVLIGIMWTFIALSQS